MMRSWIWFWCRSGLWWWSFFVESQSDAEETVTVVKNTTYCEICGVAYKGIKIHLAACKKKVEIKKLALLALSEQAEISTL